jgi:NTE family protein
MDDRPDLSRARQAPRVPIDKATLPGRVALVLQGGGALGAYQVGAYQALDEAGYVPEWFAGTSIGAINAAIMAGNPRERRLERLEEFWARICRPLPFASPSAGLSRRLFNIWSAWQTTALGQPGFFEPRPVSPWLASPGTTAAISFYDTAALRGTLESLIDLDRINGGAVRLSLGAVNVRTGEQVYFDTLRHQLGFEHIMASGALPPAFPPVEIAGEWYWDGGLVSNTPLDVVIDQLPRSSTLCFMIDLFDAEGTLPRVMEDVESRRKDIIYASRSERSLVAHRATHNLRRAVLALWNALTPEARQDSHLSALADLGCTTTMHIVRLVHRSEADELACKDYEFSSATFAEHRAAGYRDATRRLAEPTWLDPVPPDIGVIIHNAPARED